VKTYSNFLSVVIILVLCFITLSNNVAAQNGKPIKILNSDSLKFDKTKGTDLKILYGHVKFKQDSVIMFCDSAFYYSQLNYFDAYSKVHIIQNDTINIWGDSLHYEGNKRIANLRGNVKMKDRKTILTTQKFDYDMNQEIGWYYSGGKIVSEKNILTSLIGKYLAKTKELFFKTNVKLHNEDYDISTDTLRYNTNSEIAYFLGPTLFTSKDNIIKTDKGWYNTKLDIAQLEKNPLYINKEKRLVSDSMYYDRKKGYGKAYKHAVLTDTTQHISITSNYLYYKEKPEYFFAKDSIVIQKRFTKDTLFMHSDSLVGFYQDTSKTNRIIKAFHKVRFFKNDIQGKCDSMVYITKDSTIYMYTKPVLWSGKNQITGKKISIQTCNNEVEKVIIDDMAFLVSQDIDSIDFNQVKGAQMVGYFDNGQFFKLDVKKNGESIYYMRDGDYVTGVNKAICDNMQVFFHDDEVNEVLFQKSPSGTLFPPDKMKAGDAKLQDFRWLNDVRPQDRFDIFRWKE